MRATRLAATLGSLAIGTLMSAAASAVDLTFDYKINQGPVGTTFATLSINQTAPGTTTFSLDTSGLTGGQGNPGIVELLIGCNGCSPTLTPGSGVTLGPSGSTQAGYNWDFSLRFNPSAIDPNTPLTWTATSAPGTFLEATSGAGPDAFAMIQLTGGAQVVNGQNITSGFYVAAVPEPETYAMMLVGLALVGFTLRNRRT